MYIIGYARFLSRIGYYIIVGFSIFACCSLVVDFFCLFLVGFLESGFIYDSAWHTYMTICGWFESYNSVEMNGCFFSLYNKCWIVLGRRVSNPYLFVVLRKDKEDA